MGCIFWEQNCKKRGKNDDYAVAIVKEGNVVDFPNSTIHAEVTGKRVNRGAGYGLEIPVKYCFYGKAETINLVKKLIEKINCSFQGKVEKCIK